MYGGLLSHVVLVTFHFLVEILLVVMGVSSVAEEQNWDLDEGCTLLNGVDTLVDWHLCGDVVTVLDTE